MKTEAKRVIHFLGGRATRPTCMHEEGVTSDHKQASLVLLLAGLLLLVLLQLVGPAAPVTAGGGVGMMEPPEQAHQQQREQSQASGGCCTPASASSDSSVPQAGFDGVERVHVALIRAIEELHAHQLSGPSSSQDAAAVDYALPALRHYLSSMTPTQQVRSAQLAGLVAKTLRQLHRHLGSGRQGLQDDVLSWLAAVEAPVLPEPIIAPVPLETTLFDLFSGLLPSGGSPFPRAMEEGNEEQPEHAQPRPAGAEQGRAQRMPPALRVSDRFTEVGSALAAALGILLVFMRVEAADGGKGGGMGAEGPTSMLPPLDLDMAGPAAGTAVGKAQRHTQPNGHDEAKEGTYGVGGGDSGSSDGDGDEQQHGQEHEQMSPPLLAAAADGATSAPSSALGHEEEESMPALLKSRKRQGEGQQQLLVQEEEETEVGVLVRKRVGEHHAQLVTSPSPDICAPASSAYSLWSGSDCFFTVVEDQPSSSSTPPGPLETPRAASTIAAAARLSAPPSSEDEEAEALWLQNSAGPMADLAIAGDSSSDQHEHHRRTATSLSQARGAGRGLASDTQAHGPQHSYQQHKLTAFDDGYGVACTMGGGVSFAGAQFQSQQQHQQQEEASARHLSNSHRIMEKVIQGPRLRRLLESYIGALLATRDPALTAYARDFEGKFLQGRIPVHVHPWGGGGGDEGGEPQQWALGPACFALPLAEADYLRLYSADLQSLGVVPRTLRAAAAMLEAGGQPPSIPVDRTERHMTHPLRQALQPPSPPPLQRGVGVGSSVSLARSGPFLAPEHGASPRANGFMFAPATSSPAPHFIGGGGGKLTGNSTRTPAPGMPALHSHRRRHHHDHHQQQPQGGLQRDFSAAARLRPPARPAFFMASADTGAGAGAGAASTDHGFGLRWLPPVHHSPPLLPTHPPQQQQQHEQMGVDSQGHHCFPSDVHHHSEAPQWRQRHQQGQRKEAMAAGAAPFFIL